MGNDLFPLIQILVNSKTAQPKHSISAIVMYLNFCFFGGSHYHTNHAQKLHVSSTASFS